MVSTKGQILTMVSSLAFTFKPITIDNTIIYAITVCIGQWLTAYRYPIAASSLAIHVSHHPSRCLASLACEIVPRLPSVSEECSLESVLVALVCSNRALLCAASWEILNNCNGN